MYRRLSVFFALLSIMSANALAADDSFIGKWKFNPDKSQLNGLTYKVDQGENGQYKFTFGDDTETLTLGKEHVTKYGNTWLITQSGPDAWKWMQKRDGKVFSDAMWTVSDDGATSTYVSTETRPDGSGSHHETKHEADCRRDLGVGRHLGKHRNKSGLAHGHRNSEVG